MLQRFALLLLLLVVMGVSAMFAASHLGVTLPWEIAVRRPAETAPSTASNNRESPAPGAQQAEPEKPQDKARSDVLASTAEALGGKLAPPPEGSVALDISRISPDGMSVFAGRAAPDSYVTVMEDGKPAGSAKVDSNGEWSIATEHKFASADPRISFQTSTTPPPEEKPAQTAEAKPDDRPAPSASEAATVAGDVMKKFENLVAKAREEARQEREKSAQQSAAGTESPQQSGSGTAGAQPGSSTESPQSGSASGTGSATVATAEPPAKPEPAPPSAATVEPSPPTGTTAAAPTAPPPAPAPAETSTPDKGSSVAAVTAATEPNASEAVIPVPLMFVYNEATLTPEGRRAADLLLEYLRLKNLKSVELTGHADERGTEEYNYDLSRDRLETVARILKDGGFAGELKLTPKGKSEPYMGIDRSKYHGEALYQFDRRVELHLR